MQALSSMTRALAPAAVLCALLASLAPPASARSVESHGLER
jgi:hypothetical protein